MRKLPPLASLRAFEAAARNMSFRLAGNELGVTPTAISHQVRLLEDICGEPLFRRRPRPLALTAAGERLFPTLRDGFDAFALALASLSHHRERPLRVTCPNAFASLWLVARLPRWREVHPDLPLEIIGADDVLDLRADDADFAIRYARSAPDDLATKELFRDTYFPMCSPCLLPDGETRLGTADLLQHPLIHFDWHQPGEDRPTWHQWWKAARAVDPTLPAPPERWALHFREESHAIEAVLAGQGIAICSDIVLADPLREGALRRAHELSLPGFGFFLVSLHGSPRQAAAAAFGDWLMSIA